MQTRESREAVSGLRFLPAIAIGLLALIYLFTLNRWLGQDNLPALAKMNGWDWRPLHSPPLHFFVIYPISWLPTQVQPLGLSLLSFFCAILSLILLARTVAILPQERTRLQRQRILDSSGTLQPGIAWLPVTLSVVVCGLQLSFWEGATSFSTPMLDLVLFAYVVRSVAEFRRDRRDLWLYKSAFVCGLGLVNNFAMIGYFPLYLAAVIWIKGRSFFNFVFLTRCALLGLAALLLYLAIPIANALSSYSPVGFWDSLRAYLGAQKYAVVSYNRLTVLFLSMVSVVPLFSLAFRWGDNAGDISGASHQVTTVLTHIVHAAFLLLCLAAVFEFRGHGVRSLAARAGDPAVLTVFYLSALSVGYHAGYFFSIFGTAPIHRWSRPSALGKAFNGLIVALLIAAMVGIPSALLYQQWSHRSQAHGPELNQVARRIQEQLPNGALAISDTPIWYYLASAGGAIDGRAQQLIQVESSALPIPAYHARMRQKYPNVWPALGRDYPLKSSIERGMVNRFLTALSISNQVFYTEPSFGYFFEAHYLEPQGLIYRFRPLPVDRVDPPLPNQDRLSKGEAYWKQIGTEDFPALLKSVPVKKAGTGPAAASINSTVARTVYSRLLNHWGVVVQRSGLLDQAAGYFAEAKKLNPENPSAYVNAIFNQQIRTNGSPFVVPNETMTNLFRAAGGSIDTLLRVHGPIEEAGNLLVMSKAFAENDLYLQSAQAIRQVALRSPEPWDYHVAVAKLLTQAGRPDLALGSTALVRTSAPPRYFAVSTNTLDLVEAEARALFRSGDFSQAQSLLKEAIAKYPKEDLPYATLISLHVQYAGILQHQNKTNEFEVHIKLARELLETQVRAQPDNANAWINFGATFMRLEQHSTAIPYFNKALEMDRNNTAGLLNRAICFLRGNQLTQAQQDYERLRSLLPDTPYPIFYGLAEVAWRSKRNKDALGYYVEYLKKAPRSPEVEMVKERMKTLK